MSESATPKIIVDSEWKSRVESEKENLKRQEQQQAPSREASDDLPPASFPVLVSTLVTQALVALGQIVDPVAGQPSVNLPIARHFIDTLAVLEQKTKGNLDANESAMLTEVLHQLRMAYVSVQEHFAGAAPSSPIQMP